VDAGLMIAAAEVLVSGVVDDVELRDAIVGDLAEEYGALASVRGVRHADGWLRSQVVRSLPRLAADAIRRSGMRGAVSVLVAMIAGYALLAVLVIGGDMIAGMFVPSDPASVITALVSIVLAVVSALAAGYVAARLAPSAPLVAATALGVLCVVIGLGTFALGDVGVPTWYWMALQLVVLPSAVLGGLARVRRAVVASRR
jgi:hypothetical protein